MSNLDFTRTCQKCLKQKPTTRSRSIYLKNYVGPCGDSFCYASCTMSSCRPIHATVCDECEKKMAKRSVKP